MGLTADARELIRTARADEARRRVKREQKLRLPDGIDRTVYCARGLHLREDYEVIRSDGRKDCTGCKADDDAVRSWSKETCWWPTLPARLLLDEGHGDV
jgi:hypothetical protein